MGRCLNDIVHKMHNITTYILHLPPYRISTFPRIFYFSMSLSISERFRLRLAMLREARQITQQDLESQIGKETGYISRVETGRIETPPFEMIQKIGDALQVDVGEFFFVEGLDETSEELVVAINSILPTGDPRELRKIYRMILVSQEKYAK
jgi:transcriptional regulator with XRE-family HTH domain